MKCWTSWNLHRRIIEKKIEMICLIIAFVSAGILTACVVRERGMLVQARTENATAMLSKEVLRFHVIADSDSGEDQQLKMLVKESVLSYLKEELKDDDVSGDERNLSATKQFVAEHLEEIEQLSEEVLREHGSEDSVTAELVTDEFPKKRYGDIVFPAGTYEALRIRIGSAGGHNWWCCLYPNLCFTDAVHARVVEEDKEKLADVLDEDSYEMITCMTNYKIKWFFFPENQEDTYVYH